MRLTITFDDDVAAHLQHLSRERGKSLSQVVNETLRAAFGLAHRLHDYRLPTFALGLRPGIDLDRALALDAALEDEDITHRRRLRK